VKEGFQLKSEYELNQIPHSQTEYTSRFGRHY